MASPDELARILGQIGEAQKAPDVAAPPADPSPEYDDAEPFSPFDWLHELFTGKEQAEKIRSTGVDPAGAPVVVRAKEGMHQKSVEKLAALNMALRDEFKQDVPLRYDDTNKQLIFLHPKTQKWTTVETPGLSLGNLASILGELPALIGEAAALAAATGKNPTALRGLPRLARGAYRIGAAATGAGIGGYARVPIADEVAPTGELPPGTEKQTPMDSAKEAAGTSAIANTVLQPVGAGLKVLNRAVGGRSLPPDAVQAGLSLPRAAAPGVDEVNKKLAEGGVAERMKLSSGALAKDPEMLAFEAQLAGKPGPGRDAIMNMEKEQADAADAYVKLLSGPFDSSITKTDAGKATVRAAEDKFATAENAMNQRVARADADTLNKLAPIEGAASETPLSVAPEIRKVAQAEVSRFWQWAEEAYKDIGKMAKGAFGAPIEINPTNLNAISADQLAKFGNDIVPSLREENSKLVKEVLAKIADGKTVDFEQMSRFISQIKTAERAARDSPIAGVDAKALTELKRAAVADRNQAIIDYGRTDLLQALNDVEQRYGQWKTYINDSVIGKLVDRKTSLPIVKDEKMFDTVFRPKGVSDAKAFNEVLSLPENQDAREKFVATIYRKFIQEAPDQKGYDKFMSKYGDVLDVYLKPEERGALTDAGTAVTRLFELQQRRDAFQKAISNALGHNFRSADPSSVFPELWRNPGRLETAKQFLERDYPDAWKALQAVGLKQIQTEIYGPNSMLFRRRTVNADQMERLLDPGKGKAEQIQTLFGEDYLMGLELLRDATRQAQLRGTLGGGGKVESNYRTAGFDEVVANAIKLAVGPLSKGSRAMTTYLNLSDSIKQKNFAELVLNPEALADAARSYQQTRGGVLASYLGVSAVANNAREGEAKDSPSSAFSFLQGNISKNPDLAARLKAIVERDRGPTP